MAKLDYKILMNQPVGEIKAKIIERDGQILMVKECAGSTGSSKT